MIFSIRVVLAKEKTGKNMKDIKSSNKKHSDQLASSLVLSIDNNERISKFNKECERVLGYRKKEALNRPIFDFLIPERYIDQWKYLFDNSQKNKMIEDFKLPLLTKQGNEIVVSWSSFPVKNAQKVIVDISLVGKVISSFKEPKEPFIEFSKLETKETTVDNLLKDHVRKEQIENYEELNNMINNLKRKNSALEKINKNLEKNLMSLRTRIEHRKEKEVEHKKPGDYVGKGLYTFSELMSSKKRKQEFENMMRDLDDREKMLNKLESKLLKDKIKVNEQVNEFKKWRKKLESLEKEIENRQKELFTQEKLLTDKIKASGDIAIEVPVEEKVMEYHDLIDKIPDSAVVIHRGILKHVNDSFANLIGYDVNEILNKSLFDFIILEGLSDVQEYYLNRLMGVNVSAYETTLLTKDNNKISVEINTKSTFYNGKKAEIAIIKKINNKKEMK